MTQSDWAMIFATTCFIVAFVCIAFGIVKVLIGLVNEMTGPPYDIDPLDDDKE